MYIPISYWQSQTKNRADVLAKYFSTPFQGGNNPYTYKFDGTTISSVTKTATIFNENCVDVTNFISLFTGGTFLNPAGALFFCSAQLSGSSQCCINTPPETGAEAWYIDITYNRNFNYGLNYFNYIDQFGNIINDSIGFGQTKRIISQCTPLVFGSSSDFFGYRIDFNMVERFPGQVIPYPYRNVPADYTVQLKRTNQQSGTFIFPNILYQSASIVSGFPVASDSGALFFPAATSSLDATMTIRSANVLLDGNAVNNGQANSIWITNVTPVAKGALQLNSCTSTHSLWVTLNNYDYYNTGSVIRTDTTQLTATSSCWTVTNLTSSLSTSVSLNNVNIISTHGTCFQCEST